MNALSCLEMQMQDLEMEIARLQEGTMQEASKKRIMALVDRLNFCANAHKNTLGDYGEEIKSMINRLNEYLNGVIFAKDLRFELCVLSSVYLQVCENFAL